MSPVRWRFDETRPITQTKLWRHSSWLSPARIHHSHATVAFQTRRSDDSRSARLSSPSVTPLGCFQRSSRSPACLPSATAQTTVTLDASGTEVSVDTTIRGGGYASVNYGTSDTLQAKSDTRVELPAAHPAQVRHAELRPGRSGHQQRPALSDAEGSRRQHLAAYRGLPRHEIIPRPPGDLAGLPGRAVVEQRGRRPGRPLHDDERRQLRGIRVQIRSDRTGAAERQRHVRLTLHPPRPDRHGAPAAALPFVASTRRGVPIRRCGRSW